MANDKLYRLAEVAEACGVHHSTIRRWLKKDKVSMPGRDRNGWYVWTEEELKEVLSFANHFEPSPKKRQGTLFHEASGS